MISEPKPPPSPSQASFTRLHFAFFNSHFNFFNIRSPFSFSIPDLAQEAHWLVSCLAFAVTIDLPMMLQS